MEVNVTLAGSAIRPGLWRRLIDSLQANTCSWELVLVGPLPPGEKLPDNCRWIRSNVKPAQRTEIAYRAASGELIGTVVDDAIYNHPALSCPNSLDIMYEAWKSLADKNAMLGMSVYEDFGGGNVRNEDENHRFFWADKSAPQVVMCPFIGRRQYAELGGIDRNFVTGQYENDLTLRAYQAGWTVKIIKDSKYYIDQATSTTMGIPEPPIGGSGAEGYEIGRSYLERCWVKDGKISPVRLLPVEPFSDENILTVNQGPTWRAQ